MTNKRKMKRTRRIYGNLNVKKRRNKRLKELAKVYKVYDMPFVRFYDPVSCRYFRCRYEVVTAAYNAIKKKFEEYRSRVAKEFGEAT